MPSLKTGQIYAYTLGYFEDENAWENALQTDNYDEINLICRKSCLSNGRLLASEIYFKHQTRLVKGKG